MKKLVTIFSIVLLIGIVSCGGTSTEELALISLVNTKETSGEANNNSLDSHGVLPQFE
jgi:hypothetical protein